MEMVFTKLHGLNFTEKLEYIKTLENSQLKLSLEFHTYRNYLTSHQNKLSKKDFQSIGVLYGLNKGGQQKEAIQGIKKLYSKYF